MAISDYTSFEDVRAALGVSSDELDDTTLSLPLYEYSLKARLREIDTTVTTVYATLVDVTLTSLTDSQKNLKEAVYLFSTYAVALQLTVSLPLFSPKEISDGKSMQSRYTQDPYEVTIKMVTGQYEKFKKNLAVLFATYILSASATPVVRVFQLKSSPSYDPLTG